MDLRLQSIENSDMTELEKHLNQFLMKLNQLPEVSMAYSVPLVLGEQEQVRSRSYKILP